MRFRWQGSHSAPLSDGVRLAQRTPSEDMCSCARLAASPCRPRRRSDVTDRRKMSYRTGTLRLMDFVGASTAVLGVLLTMYGIRLSRRQAPAESRRRAVEGVLDALGPVRAVIEHADVRPPRPADVSRTMQRFELDWQRWEFQLPTEARHVGQSVREAMANCFGAPAVAGLDPRAAELPADPFGRRWWSLGSTWIEHAQQQLQRGLSNDRGRTLIVTPYYLWRREEERLPRPIVGRSGTPARSTQAGVRRST